MRRVMFTVFISILLLLVACESKTTGKRVAIPETEAQVKAPSGITGASTVDTGETGKTAAEMLKELQEEPTITTDGAKSGTFYPPIAVTGTEREALKEKTRALFTQSTYDPNVEADDEFGARYHDSDGDVTNLPENYDDSEDK
jgi:hypothetical protein